MRAWAASVAMGAIRNGKVFPSTGMNGKRGDKTWVRSTRCAAPGRPVGAGSRRHADVRTRTRLSSKRTGALFYVRTFDLAPPPVRHRAGIVDGGVRLRVDDREPRPPLQVGRECRAELGVGWAPHVVCALQEELHPARPLRFGELPPQVAPSHRRVPTGIGLWAAQHLGDEYRDVSRVIGL